MARKLSAGAIFCHLFLLCLLSQGCASHRISRLQSLNEWRNLNAPTAPPPRVFVRGDRVQFFFPTTNGVEAFSANWAHLRIPTSGLHVHSALLRWNQRLAHMPAGVRGWREANVIAGAEWRQFTTNLLSQLTPATAGHGFYYEAFLAGRLFYRDAQGEPHLAAAGESPLDITIEHRFSIEETLDVVGRVIEEHLPRGHSDEAPFVLMAPNANRFTQPLLVDRAQRQSVVLSPAALYDHAEGGLGLTATAQSLEALLLEGQVIALIKNPVSSVARLADLVTQTVIRFIRLPMPRAKPALPTPGQAPGMNLADWESWLDRYTGTRREPGSLRLEIDGDQFFPRLERALIEATNNVHFNVYIFDRDDVAVRVADELKERSLQIPIHVILDRLGSIAAGVTPPATPLPVDFAFPNSIISYLKDGSDVRVRPFLNPWFSADHSKTYLVDGTHAWVGGMNIGREYRYEWHDVMVELEGPVVKSLETDFVRDWAHAGALGDLGYLAKVLSTPQNREPAEAGGPWINLRLLPTRTFWKPFETAVLGSLDRAQKYIYAENPYLYDRHVVAALVRARRRGVDVRVVLPRVNDFKAGGRSNLVTANYLLEHGVRVYFYPGMSHVKALLVDDWACLGSGNLNNLSLRICQEQNIATSDPLFASKLKHQLFEQDFGRSYELKELISLDWQDFVSDVVMENF